MPNPKLELAHKYFTTAQVCKRLGLSRFQLLNRIDRKILPEPTHMDDTGRQRVRYFDENWVRMAQAILANSAQQERAYMK